jgi:hypothetical protein
MVPKPYERFTNPQGRSQGRNPQFFSITSHAGNISPPVTKGDSLWFHVHSGSSSSRPKTTPVQPLRIIPSACKSCVQSAAPGGAAPEEADGGRARPGGQTPGWSPHAHATPLPDPPAARVRPHGVRTPAHGLPRWSRHVRPAPRHEAALLRRATAR